MSAVMPSVSRIEKVSDSPCQGKELKVNSQVYDLKHSRRLDANSRRTAIVRRRRLDANSRRAYNFF